MSGQPTPEPCGAAGEPGGPLAFLTSLPGVGAALHAVTTFGIGPVTALLERAAYLPLLLEAESRPAGDAFEVAAEPRQLEIGTARVPPCGRLVGTGRPGEAAAALRFRWRVVPDDYQGCPGLRPRVPMMPLRTGVAQRIEVFDWELRLPGGGSGLRAYGAGRTLPGTAPAAGRVAFVLDVVEAFGELAGLPGTVVMGGSLAADGGFDLVMVTRMMAPAGGPLVAPPPEQPGGGGARGVTCLSFLGQIDPAHPVTLRLSPAGEILGSNVFERLRPATLGFDRGAGGALRAGATAGAVVGAVTARLSFDPLSLPPISPIQTRCGVFSFQDQAGGELGAVMSDMIEGRAFRTGLPGKLLPVFRFAGFGPIAGGSGEFAGARGLMIMNSCISVQPRTLSNLYVLCLDDPDGRYCAGAAAVGQPW